jgi:hypothetical protein
MLEDDVKSTVIALAVGTTVACSSNVADRTAELRANIGKVACNQTNGVYRGRIVDVTLYTAAGQSPTLVYVVEREGQRQNAPVEITTVAERCSDGQPAAPEGARAVAAPVPADVDPDLQAVATEFSKRLGPYQGTLAQLKRTPEVLSVKWMSQRCDLVEGEVIDLLLSINRGHQGPLAEGIKAERTCGGATRLSSTSASRFQQYRTGKINDPAILEGLK